MYENSYQHSSSCIFFPMHIYQAIYNFFFYFLYKYLALVCMFCKRKWRGLETTFCVRMSSVLKTHKENGGAENTNKYYM